VDKPLQNICRIAAATSREQGRLAQGIGGGSASSEEEGRQVDARSQQRRCRTRQDHNQKGLIDHNTTPQSHITTERAAPSPIPTVSNLSPSGC
jgi:hypothetical protein